MVHLTLAGLSADGTRLLLVDDAGAEFTLDVDSALRAALRGDHARIGQLEITMDSAIRPRDIQARIRAGETPESVAQAAQTTVERVMTYAGPVLAERAHIAMRAQTSSVRRRSGDGGSLAGGRTLGDAVAAHLRELNVDPAVVDWDSYRREDGRWTLTARFATGTRKGTATFSFDAPGNYVTVDDDDARWLVGEPAPSGQSDAPAPDEAAEPAGPRRRRLSAVPADELPLGDDAIGLVSGAPDAPAGSGADDAEDTDDADEAPTVDLTDALRTEVMRNDPADEQEPVPLTPATTAAPADGADDPVEAAAPVEHAASSQSAEPSGHDDPPRRPVKKTRGRASVPSWDEIMFGGGKQD